MKEVCSSSFDRFSNLPSHISEIILMFLPLRDMARTSILSKNWRYQWLKVPQLVFKDDPEYLLSREKIYRYTAMKVSEILLLHHGPILKFSLDMTQWSNCSLIESIIPFLSRHGIKELTLLMPNERESYKLPNSILSCVELRHLSLSSCLLQPLTLIGFRKLVNIELLKFNLDSNVSIPFCPLLESLKLDILTTVEFFSIDGAPNMKKLHFKGRVSHIGILNTPRLKGLYLIGDGKCYTGNNSFDMIDLLQSLPLLEDLCLCYRFLKALAKDDSSNKIPMLLNNLRMLELISVDVWDKEELSSTLCFIRNSPNLQKLKFSLFGHSVTPLVKPTELGPKLLLPECTRYALLKLQEVDIELHYGWCYLGRDMEFFMFLLDIFPALKTLHFKACSNTIDMSGCKMLLELSCYGRASPKSKIVYDGVDLC